MASAKSKEKSSAAAAAKKAKPKRQVHVVASPAGFPISNKVFTSRKRPRDDDKAGKEKAMSAADNYYQSAGRRKKHNKNKNKDSDGLDWHDTAKEIRAYGATAFVGKQKRDYDNEQYFNLTGRRKKQQMVPLPIVRGIKKAAAKRDDKKRQEAKEAGIVLPKAKKETKKESNIYKTYGPAPNIGFMKAGVLKVNQNKKYR